MTSFTVHYRGRESDGPLSDYLFDVSCDGRKVVELCHDHLGAAHRIRRPGERWQPLAKSVLQGGTPYPLELSPEGRRTVEAFLAG